MTLLIKNVKILGGERNYSDSSDVFVNGDRISAIGNFPRKNADETLDGSGAYLAPGFIDVNTDSDHYMSLFTYPSQEDFLRQGVTTIMGGMCGASLAPLLYGSLESIRKWTDITRFNVNWHTITELLKIINRRGLGVNFGTLVGHSTIRRAIVGDRLRDLTKNELEVFSAMLSRAMDEGAFGFSTGLSYVHAFKTSNAEIKALAKIVKKYDGVYATHLRKKEGEVLESIDETIQLAEETKVKTIVSHFMPIKKFEKEYENALEKITALAKKVDFHFDMYPTSTSVLALYTFLPTWAQNGEREVMVENMKDEWFRGKVEKELPSVDADALTVAQAPGNEFLVGKSLRQLAGLYDIKVYKLALIKLMLATNLNCMVFYKNIAKPLIEEGLKNPRSLIGSNAASFENSESILKADRATATFTKFLEFAEVKNQMPLEDAIRKMTAIPAKKFGLKDRGTVKEGAFADLTIFKDAVIKAVVVNGALAMKNGEYRNTLSGRALKKE